MNIVVITTVLGCMISACGSKQHVDPDKHPLDYRLDTVKSLSDFIGSDFTIRELLKLFANAVENSASYLFTQVIDVPIEEDIKFFCSNPEFPDQEQVFLGDSSLPRSINTSKPTTFLIHGWIDNANRTWMQETAKDHKKYRDANICLVDWSRLANYEYSMSASFTRRAGAYVASFIMWLVKYHGAELDDITLVGHSLGGHIAGFSGKKLNGQIGQIIALDPAGPLFTFPFDNGPDERLHKGDAKFVQVLHTSGMTLGVFPPCGHVDFYPNAGLAPMNGCPWEHEDPPEIIACSHLRACSYFRASLNPTNKFFGRHCKNPTSWIFSDFCILNESINRFGYEVSRNYTGNFFFSTSWYFPYTKEQP